MSSIESNKIEFDESDPFFDVNDTDINIDFSNTNFNFNFNDKR